MQDWSWGRRRFGGVDRGKEEGRKLNNVTVSRFSCGNSNARTSMHEYEYARMSMKEERLTPIRQLPSLQVQAKAVEHGASTECF